jgi:hypothetical protein
MSESVKRYLRTFALNARLIHWPHPVRRRLELKSVWARAVREGHPPLVQRLLAAFADSSPP